MKISYFFNISVVISRSDMKQKAKNLLQSMLDVCMIIFHEVITKIV